MKYLYIILLSFIVNIKAECGADVLDCMKQHADMTVLIGQGLETLQQTYNIYNSIQETTTFLDKISNVAVNTANTLSNAWALLNKMNVISDKTQNELELTSYIATTTASTAKTIKRLADANQKYNDISNYHNNDKIQLSLDIAKASVNEIGDNLSTLADLIEDMNILYDASDSLVNFSDKQQAMIEIENKKIYAKQLEDEIDKQNIELEAEINALESTIEYYNSNAESNSPSNEVIDSDNINKRIIYKNSPSKKTKKKTINKNYNPYGVGF